MGGIPSISSVYLQGLLAWPGSMAAVAQLTLEIVSSSSFPALLVSSNVLGHMMQEVDHTRNVKFINNGSD